jgi:hypothetical protein
LRDQSEIDAQLHGLGNKNKSGRGRDIFLDFPFIELIRLWPAFRGRDVAQSRFSVAEVTAVEESSEGKVLVTRLSEK